MPPLLLATKLYIPPPRPNGVARPHLLGRLDAGLARPLTVVSAPAGFGKTTLLAAWAAAAGHPVAWLTLDAGDSDPAAFLTYLVAALRTVRPGLGERLLPVLAAPQPPPVIAVLTGLLNELAAIDQEITLVLDDYHAVASPAVDAALAFLVEHLPARLHLVIATREDPPLPLARLRAGGRLQEVRAADLRFTLSEAAVFLNEAMGLHLDADEVAALEARTEGWIAGLQLAALSLQGRADAAAAIDAFTGSHHFVLDYLLAEVLGRQPQSVQTFLLRTSVLDRLCGPLCDAVVHGEDGAHPGDAASGQDVLRELERANLFLIPLDDERRWYRYHHLFRDLLRQRLLHSLAAEAGSSPTAAAPDTSAASVAVYHQRASRWFEGQGLEVEAFQHATAAGDIAAAARLAQGKEMPLHFRGAVAPVLHWLASLPPPVLQAAPGLNVLYASALVYAGRLGEVEEKLAAAESQLPEPGANEAERNLLGHVAALRAMLAVSEHAADEIVAESARALAYLHPNNRPIRAAMTWSLGYAHELRGERAAAAEAYAAALASSQALGHFIVTILSLLGLGSMEAGANRLDAAAASYRRVLQVAGDPPLPVACDAYLGLARVCYERNDLPAAQEQIQQAMELAQQLPTTDRLVAGQLFAARLALALGDVDGAAVLAAAAEDATRRHRFAQRIPDLAAVRTLILLRRGDLPAAAQAAASAPPLTQARVRLALGDGAGAAALLASLREEAESRGWADERLRVLVLQALAEQAQGNAESGLRLLREALAAAEPGGFVRLFVDEGAPLARLLRAAAGRGIMPRYVAALLAACAGTEQPRSTPSGGLPGELLGEPLSERELEVLRLIAQGLTNQQIGERLFLALDTVKGHNRRIFAKLQVARRTEAIAKARALRLLPPDPA